MAGESSRRAELTTPSPVTTTSQPSTQPPQQPPLQESPLQQPVLQQPPQQPFQQPPQQPYLQYPPPNPRLTGQYMPYHQYAQAHGQPFDQWQPPQTITQPIPQPQQQPEVPKNKSWEWTKIGLHIATIVFCTIGLSITFSLIGHSDAGEIALACCPVLAVALIWSIAELICRCARGTMSGIHPGAQVAVCLIVWLAASGTGGIEAALVGVTRRGFYNERCYDREAKEYVNCRDQIFNGRRPQFVAVASFTCLLWLVQFILFVGACVDTAKRNAAARRPIMVVGPPYWGPPAQGWQPMPQNAQGQYMTVPQQDIPLQNRNSAQTAPQQSNGKEGTYNVTEFYRPGGGQ